jgi:hypothetical protein
MNRNLLSLLFFTALSPLVAQGGAAPVPVPAKANTWFSILDQDLGTYFHHEEAVGHFPFQNPSNEPFQFKSFGASCQCSRALIRVGGRHYEYSNKPTPNMLVRITEDATGKKEERVSQIDVGANEAGEVEVHMDMAGHTGIKQASLDVHTTDPVTPFTKLQWHATGAQMFVLSPADINLNQMSWNESREFSLVVTSPVNKDFNIIKMDDAGPDFHVAYDKEVKDGAAVWTIHGTYGPIASEAGGGGALKFYTDLKGETTFMVRVQALVTGPLDVKPGSFLPLGRIKKGTARSEKITFEPNDGSDLDATSVKFDDSSVDVKFLSYKTTKDGKKLIVEIEVSKDAPTGLLKGTVVVGLNHAAVKERKITFNGFIR